MKIVLFPGVAIDKVEDCHEYFLNQLTTKLNCEGEIIAWEIGHKVPIFDLPLKNIREYLCKVVLDFQTVALHAIEMKVPDADIYLGHSAGSVIALAQKGKNCITFGSPAALVECVKMNIKSTSNIPEMIEITRINDIIKIINDDSRKILNIINKYDVIAYPINKPNVNNFEYSNDWYNPLTYIPTSAHHDYWESKIVINKIIESVKNW